MLNMTILILFSPNISWLDTCWIFNLNFVGLMNVGLMNFSIILKSSEKQIVTFPYFVLKY